MKSFWLAKNNTKKLIIFFSGWAMDETPFKYLFSREHDVLIFYDYSDFFIDKSLIDKINSYKEIVIISWSMGVYVGSQVAKHFNKAKKAIAINGTLMPLDNVCGIPLKIVDLTLNITLKVLSEKNIGSFYKNIFYENSDFKKFLKTRPQRNICNQKEELEKIKEYYQRSKEILINSGDQQTILTRSIENIYDFAIIGLKDRVFLAKNQKNAWQNTKTNIILIDQAHHPFYIWKNWEDIINLCNL
ncbi:MAG: pimeloyl-ACP methyl esterase BioG family protein [Candidatus Gastranaerophilaceae bacterium]|jgi:biotin synthesis protein BioG